MALASENHGNLKFPKINRIQDLNNKLTVRYRYFEEIRTLVTECHNYFYNDQYNQGILILESLDGNWHP